MRAALNMIYGLLVRREVFGLENVPTEGPCLLVFNHLSNFDAHLLYCLVDRKDLTGLFAADYRAHPFFRFMVEAPGGLWLRRGEGDRSTLRAALDLLERGWLVGIAPEGRRSSTAALNKARRGAAFLASRADVPILPVGIAGTERIAAGMKRLRRVMVTVRVGAPFMLPSRQRGGSKQHLQACTDLIMCRIAAQLPIEYRGAYAAHAHLHELQTRTASIGVPDPDQEGGPHDRRMIGAGRGQEQSVTEHNMRSA